MSGSSGGGFSVGGGGSGTDCSGLVFTTHVASPQATVISKLEVDEVLPVVLQDRRGGRVVAILTAAGDFVGGVAAPQLERLRQCMDSGTDYDATVLSISGAAVRVRIAVRGA